MTLATRSALLLSTVFMLVFGTAVVLSLGFFEERFVAVTGQYQLKLLQEYGQNLETKISTAHSTLAAAGQLLDAKMLANPASAAKFLESRTFLQRNFKQGLYIFGTTGELIASSPGASNTAAASAAATPTEMTLVQSTLARPEPHVSLAFAKPGAPKQPVIALSAPIFDANHVLLGVIQGSLELLDKNYAGSLVPVKIGDTGYLYMIDKQRTMLFHPDRARWLSLATKPGQNAGLDRAVTDGFQGSTDNVNSTGLHALSTFVQLKSLGWILAANFPMSEVREPFRRSLATIAGVALVAGALIFLAVIFVVRRTLLPVRLLTRHLVEVGQGQARPMSIPNAGELGLMTQAYNQMLTELNASEAARMDGERRLRELNASLEHRVQERTEELGKTNSELQLTLSSNETMKNELVRSEKLAALGKMVAGLAHELNTPIGNALLAASALRVRTQNLSKLIDEGVLKRSELRDFQINGSGAATLVENNLMRAADLINNFKQVAVDQTAEHRREFQLDKTIVEVLSTMDYMVRTRPILVHQDLQLGITMQSYPGPLGQVIINFFTNALTHAFAPDKDGEIWIRAALTDDDWVTIEFKDNGVGIPQEHVDKVFDPFFTTRLGQGGSGLGLSIAYNIATAMLGGHINVYSNPEQGTTFTVLLPRVAPDLTAKQKLPY